MSDRNAKASESQIGENECIVAQEDEIGVGERLILSVNEQEIGIFNVDGEFHAYPNWCPHMGGPLCEGPLDGTLVGSFDRDTLEMKIGWGRDDEMLTCPWHGYEFDIVSGDCLSDSRLQLREIPIRVENGRVILSMK